MSMYIGSEKLKQELEELQSQYGDLEETSNSQKTVIAEMKTTIEEVTCLDSL